MYCCYDTKRHVGGLASIYKALVLSASTAGLSSTEASSHSISPLATTTTFGEDASADDGLMMQTNFDADDHA
jgi:hypothetical protein